MTTTHSESQQLEPIPDVPPTEEAKPKRPAKGERRTQILQTLAAMLGEPGANRITVAALAERVGVQEAALYRHFKGKAEMFTALVEWIDSTIMGLADQIREREPDARKHAALLVTVLLQFGEKNPGMSCVMAGDGLVLEDEKVKARLSHFFERVEMRLRESLYVAFSGSATPTVEASIRASLLVAYARGRLQDYVRTNYHHRHKPTSHLEPCLQIMLA